MAYVHGTDAREREIRTIGTACVISRLLQSVSVPFDVLGLRVSGADRVCVSLAVPAYLHRVYPWLSIKSARAVQAQKSTLFTESLVFPSQIGRRPTSTRGSARHKAVFGFDGLTFVIHTILAIRSPSHGVRHERKNELDLIASRWSRTGPLLHTPHVKIVIYLLDFQTDSRE